MARRKKGLAAQKGLVALVALVSVGVLGYFTFMVVDEQSNAQFEEGTHFETLATPRRVRGDEIEVMEFFLMAVFIAFVSRTSLRIGRSPSMTGLNSLNAPSLALTRGAFLANTFIPLSHLRQALSCIASPSARFITDYAVLSRVRN